jgi:hypothetical protein
MPVGNISPFCEPATTIDVPFVHAKSIDPRDESVDEERSWVTRRRRRTHNAAMVDRSVFVVHHQHRL